MMNKRRVLLLSSALAFVLSMPCSANQVQGLIESIDPLNSTIRIKDPVSGSGTTIHVHPKIISEVRIGSVVKATLPSGSDTADTFEVLTSR